MFAEREGLEDLTLGPDGELYAACGNGVLRLTVDGTFSSVAEFDRAVTALAFCADGTLAVGLGNAVAIGTASAGTIDSCDGRALNAVNALHARPDGTLLISEGSATRPYRQWSHDLMEKGRTGRLLQHDPRSGKTTALASNLAFCFGAFADAQGRAFGSESWKHQLTGVAAGRPGPAVVAGLPGYPARMAAAEGGGFWLSVFACRTQLVEFVLGEDDYRREMMKTIE
ncbi:MAG TPA: strictosidine synthase, partial [Burkholderiaceae bacterium]